MVVSAGLAAGVALAPGEWQTLDVIFVPPEVDKEGKRTAKARLERATLNDQVIHDKLELEWPTGNNWKNDPKPTGPILLQADHGPIAFRNVKVRPWKAGASEPSPGARATPAAKPAETTKPGS